MLKSLKVFGLFLCALPVMLSSCFPVVREGNTSKVEEVNLSAIAGTWTGLGQQDNNSSWQVRVTIAERSFINGVAAEVDYPSLGCGGIWKLQSANGNSFELVESITYGRTRCIPTVLVNLAYRSDKRVLVANYADPENNPRARAVAVLEPAK